MFCQISRVTSFCVLELSETTFVFSDMEVRAAQEWMASKLPSAATSAVVGEAANRAAAAASLDDLAKFAKEVR